MAYFQSFYEEWSFLVKVYFLFKAFRRTRVFSSFLLKAFTRARFFSSFSFRRFYEVLSFQGYLFFFLIFCKTFIRTGVLTVVSFLELSQRTEIFVGCFSKFI